jgi:protein-tyrosine-phosphatase
MAKWKFRTYDVWGNKEDGFEVNDVYSAGSVDGPANPTDAQALKMFKAAGIIVAKATVRDVTFDGDDAVIYATETKSGYPLGEAHKG